MKICASPKPFLPHPGLECCRPQGHPGMHLDYTTRPDGQPQRISWFAPDRLITSTKTGPA